MAETPSGAKVVNSESAPVISAVLLVAALQDTWGLFVTHWDWWQLSGNLFTLAGFALFFGLRRLNGAAGNPVDMQAVRAEAMQAGREAAAADLLASGETDRERLAVLMRSGT